MNRSNLRCNLCFLSHFNRFLPLNKSCWCSADMHVINSMVLVFGCLCYGMNILSEGTAVEDTSLWLISFNGQNSVCFLTDSMKDNAWHQWIWSWFFMIDLHPTWTEHILFCQVFMLGIFHWSLSIVGICINGYNSLML
jgi:hypothetical protein